MDTAMRDMDQLRERGDESTGRKVGLFAMAGILSVAAVFAMGIMVGRGDTATQPPAQDPLAQLIATDKVKAQDAKPKESEVKAATLSFPSTLLEREDPAVEATVRAAEAEHAALVGALPPAEPVMAAPLPVPTPAPEPSLPPLELEAAHRPAERPAAPVVPLATLATEDTARLSRVARHDPLVAKALPTSAPEEVAPRGYEGAYTLQVVSYESNDQAERFAKNLRARGHKAFVMQADVPGRGRFYRVRIGPFETRQEASGYQRNFEDTEKMHTIMVSQASQNAAH